ncbi:MAG: hypothetical protein ACE5EH_10765 [Gammaproteobacteria bacterium]
MKIVQTNKLSHCKKQSGYILLLVTMFLFILMGTSAQFMNRVSDGTKLSSMVSDNSESLLLAESAMNMLMGKFANTLDSDNDAIPDNQEAGNIQSNLTNPNAFLMPYMYYVTTGAGIDQNAASLLQKVADGEASGATVEKLTQQQVASNVNLLRVNALFISNTVKPKLYTQNNNGLLIDSTAADWANESGTAKAASWIELIENPNVANALDIYVQSVAQVGISKSYVQRYVGSYFPVTTIGTIAVLAEASNINRNGP